MAGKPFSIDVAPTAWTSVGRVRGDAFRRIRRELEGLASELVARMSADADEEASIVIDQFRVSYTVDARAGKILIVDIEERIPDVG